MWPPVETLNPCLGVHIKKNFSYKWRGFLQEEGVGIFSFADFANNYFWFGFSVFALKIWGFSVLVA